MDDRVMLRSVGSLIMLTALSTAQGLTQTGSPEPSRAPLAYVRRLAIAPVALATRPDAPLPPTPPADKKALARWQAQQKSREQFVRLRAETLQRLEEVLSARLALMPGLSLTPQPRTGCAPGLWADPLSPRPEMPGRPVVGRNPEGRALPLAEPLAGLAREAGADAALAVAVDRFGTQTGLERGVWLRLIAYVMPTEGGALRGPFHALGWARTGRKLFVKGFQKSDSRLAREAAAQAVGQLTHTLQTGQDPPFAREARVVVVPAMTPQAVEKRFEETTETTRIPLPSLVRQRDVLWQPALSPVIEWIDADEMQAALRALRLEAASFWTPGGHPAVESVQSLAERLRADYVFASRLMNLELTERARTVLEDGQPRAGVERRAEAEAEALLLRAADGRILWRDQAVGTATTRTDYVRGKPRILTEEQCVLDAVRTAYIHLRFSLAGHKKRYER